MSEQTEGGQVWLWAIISIVIIAGLGILFFYTAERNNGELNTGDLSSLEESTNDPVDANTTIGGSSPTNNITTNNTNTTVNEENKNIVVFTTNFGTITLELFRDKAPNTSENFEELAKIGFYEGTRFHRVIADFMIQGGDPQSKDISLKNRWGTGGPGYQFADEINDEKLVKGVLAMANSGPDTNGSQFFIVTAESTPWLDGAHTAFGRVIEGMDVVEKIGAVATGPNDVPLEDVIIQKVELR